jgi:hypothetical protein
MENTNIAKSNSLANEMKINLHMLDTLMLNRVCRKVDRRDVVTVDHSSSMKRVVELGEELV